jgi:hypothetical protein
LKRREELKERRVEPLSDTISPGDGPGNGCFPTGVIVWHRPRTALIVDFSRMF